MKKFYFLLVCLLSFSVFSQDVLMQNGTFNRCAPDVIYDSGGEFSNYSSNENIVTTICPQNVGEFILLNFTSFNTENGADVLTIYDGDDTTASIIGTYSGTNSPGSIQASAVNTSGCITLEFVSNAGGTFGGWSAEIFCAVPCQTITPTIDTTLPVANSSGVIEILPGENVDFTGSATFSNDGTGATYNWNFGGANNVAGLSASNVFNNSGSYTVTFTVTDASPLACTETVTISVIVLESIVTINSSAYTESSFTPEELIENVLVSGGCSAVDNFSFQVNGTPTDLQTKSYGYFRKGGAVNFPFEEGIILTTGRAFGGGNTFGPTGVPDPDYNNGQPGDLDLQAALGQVNTNDATFIKFNFVPTQDNISFRYIMASEEYDGSTECSFADSFAFLLREVGTTAYTNLAVLPDGITPVSVTNINNAGGCNANPTFFAGYNTGETNYGGRTVVLTAVANVVANVTYEIKLVVADQGDSAWDSAIFLEAGSFNLGGDLGDDITIAAGTAACGGDSITLDTQAVSATHTWYKDTVEITGETSSTLDITEPGTYSVDVVFAPGCEASDTILVEFKSSPIANVAQNLSICALSGVGQFNLTDNDDDILGTQNPLDYIITYHLTEQDAIDNLNPLTSPYTNVSSPQTVYTRIADLTQECFDTTSFDLTFNNITIDSPLSPLQVCDDATADGLAMFTLTDRDAQVIGTLDASTVNVSYYENQVDADSGMNELLSPYMNTSNNQIIYVRLEANSSAACYNTATLELVVNPLPNPIVPIDYEVCDDDNDGFSSFDLTLKDTEVLNGQTGMTVSYYETLSDAQAGVDALTSPYNNTAINTQSIFVRLEDDATGCYDTVQFSLFVHPIPTIGIITNEVLCDDNNPSDLQELFDLSSKTSEILNGQINTNVTFHVSQTDAEDDLNALASPYLNVSTPQTIYVRLENTITSCSNIGTFNLIVNPLPALIPPTALEVCDDGVPDGLTSIDLTLKNLEITGNNPDYSVSYYLT
ncbi:choice-of-anchor L domain-containing protein, partial [Ichthyenterobacterium magnum]